MVLNMSVGKVEVCIVMSTGKWEEEQVVW